MARRSKGLTLPSQHCSARMAQARSFQVDCGTSRPRSLWGDGSALDDLAECRVPLSWRNGIPRCCSDSPASSCCGWARARSMDCCGSTSRRAKNVSRKHRGFVLGSSSSDGFPQKPQRPYLVRTARVQPPSIFPISRLWVEKYSRWESESRRSRCAIRTSTRARVSALDAAASSATLSRT